MTSNLRSKSRVTAEWGCTCGALGSESSRVLSMSVSRSDD